MIWSLSLISCEPYRKNLGLLGIGVGKRNFCIKRMRHLVGDCKRELVLVVVFPLPSDLVFNELALITAIVVQLNGEV